VAPLYCLLKNLDNIQLKFPYTIKHVYRVGCFDVVYHDIFNAVTMYVHLSFFKYVLGPQM